MNAFARLLLLLLPLYFCTLADTGLLPRVRRGTRNYRDRCVDADSAALRENGDTWLRWRGQKVEFCHCVPRARARCYYIPITNFYFTVCLTALLKLKSTDGFCVINSPEVLPVCLPEPGMVLPDWMECEISGYGKEREFSAFYSDRVKQGHVRLWPQELCVPEKLSGREITQNMLCAGDTRGLDDACKGDSGGPLVCEKDRQMTLIGLISWGDGCGKKDIPGVYTRVTKYTTWISSKMRSN
ncbi:salivary plasminogen activator gamma [Clarias gariepinus]